MYVGPQLAKRLKSTHVMDDDRIALRVLGRVSTTPCGGRHAEMRASPAQRSSRSSGTYALRKVVRGV
jgi:hypothetical protein